MNTVENLKVIAVEKIVIKHSLEKIIGSKDGAQFSNFEGANKLLSQFANKLHAEQTNGYYKFNFLVKWVDGAEWTGVVDVTAEMKDNGFILNKRIIEECTFNSGVKPANMDEQKYKFLLEEVAGINEAAQEKFREFLIQYDLN